MFRIKATQLVKKVGSHSNEVTVINHINLAVSSGEFVAILGSSGSGKSTLLHLLGGLDYPDEGIIELNGMKFPYDDDDELTEFRRKNIGFVFQSANLIQGLNAEENILLPVNINNGVLDDEYFSEIVNKLGIADLLHRLPNHMSGGEQQRVAIARALICKPSVILADEPTGNLDSKNSMVIANLLKENSSYFNQAIIVVTHDFAVANLADRVITLQDGRWADENAGNVNAV